MNIDIHKFAEQECYESKGKSEQDYGLERRSISSSERASQCC